MNILKSWQAFWSGKSSTRCWVCRTPVMVSAENPWETSHQDTLGGPWSLPACAECKQRRATSVSRLADLALLGGWPAIIGGADRTPSEAPPIDFEIVLAMADADGDRGGQPIHVWHDGSYHTVRDWLRTGEHTRLVEVARKRRRPAHQLG